MSECDKHGHYANFGICPECRKQEHGEDKLRQHLADLGAERDMYRDKWLTATEQRGKAQAKHSAAQAEAVAFDEIRAERVQAWDEGYELARRLVVVEQERNALKADNASLAELCNQARVEIDEHWSAHTDEDGYGPTSLMQRLENAADGKVFDHAYYIQRIGLAEAARDRAVAEGQRLRFALEEIVALPRDYTSPEVFDSNVRGFARAALAPTPATGRGECHGPDSTGEGHQ